jgi:hypothetical protein
MCLAIYKPAGEKIPFTEIKQAWTGNKDGAGLAVRMNGSVEIHKGFMSLSEYTDFIGKFSEELRYLDVVFHLRYTTSGNTVPGMTHPFPVSKKNNELKALYHVTDKAIIHNGVMFNPMSPSHGYSDTAIFSKWLALKNPDEKEMKKVLGGDRLAIVTGEKVSLMGNWTEIAGCFYSQTYSINTYRSSSLWSEPRKGKVLTWDPKSGKSMKEVFDDYEYKDEEFDVDALMEMDFCPSCGSDRTEQIGYNTITFECLDCCAVYNQYDCLDSFTSKLYDEDEEKV